MPHELDVDHVLWLVRHLPRRREQPVGACQQLEEEQDPQRPRHLGPEPATQAVTPAAATPAAAAPPPATRSIAPDELAALLKRAKGLLAVGDITSARLLLERAADAQEAEAALMLAGTYDPQVLGTQDMRSITPDPAAARLWYQKAAQLGSVDAKRRLQSQN